MESNATGESSPSWTAALARALSWLFRLSLALTAAALVQQYSGIGLRVRHDMENDRIQRTEDYYRWRLPEQYRTPLVDRAAVLLQDGRPALNRSQSNRLLREYGPGWYHMVGGGVNFLPEGGLDPRSSAVRWSLDTPFQFKPKIWPKVAAVLLAQLLLLQVLRRAPARPGASAVLARAWRVATPGVAVLAVVMLAAALRQSAGFTDHAFVVKGIQESDAGGWYQMAVGLSEGRGLTGAFENQRPFYSLFLAGLFMIFGEGLAVLRGFNALGLLGAALGVLTLARLLGSSVIGGVLVLTLLAAEAHSNYLTAALTENGGLMLAVPALLTVWLAAWTLSVRWAAVAGVINGLAAITSGVTLFTLPAYALLVVLFPLGRRVAWRRALLLGVVYTAGASIIVGSWLVRQKLAHDRFALSYNSAEVLAGGSDPEEGRFTGRVLEKARAFGLDLSSADNRYEAMLRLFRSHVVADPAGYAHRVWLAGLESLSYLPTSDPVVQTCLLLALLAWGGSRAWSYGQWQALAVAGGLMTLWARAGFVVTPLLLAAAVFLLLRRGRAPAARLAVLLLAATVLAVMLLAGLAGNVATKRFWLVADWCVLALVLGGARAFIGTISDVLQFAMARAGLPAWLSGWSANAPSVSAAFTPPRFIAVSALFVLALSLTCGGLVLVRTVRGPVSLAGSFEPPPASLTEAALNEAAKRRPELRAIPREKIVTRLVLPTDQRAYFAASEGTQHWLPFYAARPYERWVAQFRLLDAEGAGTPVLTAVARGGLPEMPRRVPMLLAGVFSTGRNGINGDPVPIFEALFVLPLDTKAPHALDGLQVLPPSPEALAAAR